MDTGSRAENASKHVSFGRNQQPVMPGFMPGIYVFGISVKKTWMVGIIGERKRRRSSSGHRRAEATPFFERYTRP
jgi:hypothetical protein